MTSSAVVLREMCAGAEFLGGIADVLSNQRFWRSGVYDPETWEAVRKALDAVGAARVACANASRILSQRADDVMGMVS